MEHLSDSFEKTPEWEYIDTLLSENRARVEYLDFINPANSQEERQKFLDAYARGEEYHPQFTYESTAAQKTKLQQAREVLSSEVVTQYAGEHAEIFGAEREHQIARLNFIREGIGSEEWDQSKADALFGPIDSAVAAYAVSQLEKTPEGLFPTGEEELTADEVTGLAQEALDDIGADGWSFAFQPQAGMPPVIQLHEKRILFDKQLLYKKAYIEMLIAHEMYGHLVQTIGSQEQDLEVLRTGAGRVSVLMEGFALHEESRVNPLTERRVSFYYHAITYALEHSLYETFIELKKYELPDMEAYAIASRVKRGMTDTSQPGSWMKDKIYLEGLLAYRDMSDADRKIVARGLFGPELLDVVRPLLTKETQ